MGSDWLACPVCCDLLNRLVRMQKRHSPYLSGMFSGCIVNNGAVNIAYQFEPDWDPENISEEDRAEPVQAHGSYRTFQNGTFLFVCCCFIFLNTLLFVNATGYVSF